MSAALFQQLVEESGRLSPDTAAWIGNAFDRWLSGEPVEAAMGLKPGPGQRKPATLIRTEYRNDALRKAWGSYPGTPWQKSRALAEAIGRLSQVYRRYRAGHPPASEVNRLLCTAADYGRLPEKPNQIHVICVE